MDARVLLGKSQRLTGSRLLLAVTAALSLFAVSLDLGSDRPLLSVVSLTFPFVACAVLTAIVGFWAVPMLRALKAGQVIREDGPQAHLKKAGTPTMGGIFVIPTAVFIALVFTRFALPVIAVSALTFAYGLIGFIDDWQILKRRSNKGISPRMKLILQVGLGTLFCVAAFAGNLANWFSYDLELVALPFGLVLPLGLLFWPLAGFVLVAESNATNLTDGLDGLAGGTGAIVLMGLGAAVAPVSPELMVFCACLSGSFVGFLVHNRNPAKVFMGDTGSLAMGGALAAVAILTQSLWVLLIAGGLFVWESVSVIAQVSYYKATKDENGIGKRLFKMAPFHHHLELTGWSETQVVAIFYSASALLVGLALTFPVAIS